MGPNQGYSVIYVDKNTLAVFFVDLGLSFLRRDALSSGRRLPSSDTSLCLFSNTPELNKFLCQEHVLP